MREDTLSPCLEEKPKPSQTTFQVLFISSPHGGIHRYRCFQPQEQLKLGIAGGFRTSNDLRLLFQDILG